MPSSRIAPLRISCQWLSAVLVLGLPFLQAGGESLLRMDAPSRTLLFFGARIRIEEFYLFLIVVLLMVFGFLMVTTLFGRVWCGWLCPQTTVTDLVEFIGRKTACTSPVLAGFLRQLCYVIISGGIAANLIWYFIPPPEFVQRLTEGRIGAVAGSTFVAVFVLLYLDLVFVRRSFCRTVCPYGRIQLMLMDRNTLALEFDPLTKDRCIGCGSCTRACPMGIDIKDGLQIECINCGRCVDACRDVAEKQGGKGLIHYTFGRKEENRGFRLDRKMVFLAAVFLSLCSILAAGIATRKEATIKIQRAGNSEIRIIEGKAVVNFFSAYIENRSTIPARYELAVPSPPGYRVELLGPTAGIELSANANRRIDFLVKVAPIPPETRRLELRLMREGKTIAFASLTLLVN